MRDEVMAGRDGQFCGTKAFGTDKLRDRWVGNPEVCLQEFLHRLFCEYEASGQSVQQKATRRSIVLKRLVDPEALRCVFDA